ncbi:LLM class flavin-dependent oxidoreductase [Nitrospira sp. Nam74]
MQEELPAESIEVFSTCPQSADVKKEDYRQSIIDVSQWSEEFGCKGMLIYSDNRLVDPWLVAQISLEHTKALCPLVAIQPIYMHPYTVATLVSSYGLLYGRRIYLNMIAGGFKNDLIALNDSTPHDQRYERLREYTIIIKELLAGKTVTYEGRFYTVTNLKLAPPMPDELFPCVFMSGSSDAGLEACRLIGATAIKYPKSSRDETVPLDEEFNAGIRIGIIARDNADDAWHIAHERFPVSRKGQITHQVAMNVSDSVWHKQLSQLAGEAKTHPHPYWLVPFENYKTFCPYLVGSYEEVSQELARYIKVGFKSFILDIPFSREELDHSMAVFRQAARQVS